MNKVIKLILQILLMLAVSAVQLYSCTVAWRLIAVPMGAPPIDIMSALGIGWLISLMAYDGRNRSEQPFSDTLVNVFVHTGVVMFFVFMFFGR